MTQETAAQDLAHLSIYVIALEGVKPAECSAAANSAKEAKQLVLESLSADAQGRLQSMELIEEIKPEGRSRDLRPMLPSDFWAWLNSWKADPCGDLHCPAFAQHDDYLREVQKQQEAQWEKEEQEREAEAEAALADRAAKAGIPIEVQRRLEVMQHRIDKLERALYALIDSGGARLRHTKKARTIAGTCCEAEHKEDTMADKDKLEYLDLIAEEAWAGNYSRTGVLSKGELLYVALASGRMRELCPDDSIPYAVERVGPQWMAHMTEMWRASRQPET